MRDRFDPDLDTPIPFGLSPELQRRADELGVAVDRRPYEPPAIVAESDVLALAVAEARRRRALELAASAALERLPDSCGLYDDDDDDADDDDDDGGALLSWERGGAR